MEGLCDIPEFEAMQNVMEEILDGQSAKETALVKPVSAFRTLKKCHVEDDLCG